jgi:hypothetical protein
MREEDYMIHATFQEGATEEEMAGQLKLRLSVTRLDYAIAKRMVELSLKERRDPACKD